VHRIQESRLQASCKKKHAYATKFLIAINYFDRDSLYNVNRTLTD